LVIKNTAYKLAVLEDAVFTLKDFEELKGENTRLNELLKFRQEQKYNFFPSRVIGRDVSLFFRTLEIDRGFEDGIEPGMSVVSPAGIVGRILRTSPRSSSVLLISDINSKIEAVVQRSRTRVIVGGSVDGNLTLRFLPRRFDVRQGDVIVSTDVGGKFPAGFHIGVIVGIGEDPNLVLQQAELEPAVTFDSLEEVYIVKAASK
jgi:rod shape-determining protein MreC